MKIEPVNGHNPKHADKVSGADIENHRQLISDDDESVRISEEGKKKLIFGALLARISEKNR